MSHPHRPPIKSYAALTVADLDATPVWINCHTADEDQSWYDETGEDDYRPYTGEPPVPPYKDLFVVRAVATLSDGSMVSALIDLLPVGKTDRDNAANASLFAADGRRVSLLPALMGLSEQVRMADLSALDRTEAQIFPVVVRAEIVDAPVVTVLDWFTHQVGWPSGR